MVTYESLLDANLEFALREGSMHFEENNAVHKTLRNLTRRLNELQIPYAVMGAMAMFAHGFRRFTEVVEILVTPEGMERIRGELEGRGYVQPQGTTTKLRDADTKVKIEFLITGGFPGDNKPKPVTYPDPAAAAVEIEGIRYLGVPTLIDLKLASGMTGGASRLKDLGDVIELIRAVQLPESLADQLNPYVRDKYLELWRDLRAAPDPHDA